MNTDNYDFEKSSVPQDLDGYTPFIDKQCNSYINDQNSGVYSASQSLVQFDLSSLYNSSRWTNTADAFITLPIVMVHALNDGTSATPLAIPTAGWALQCLKSGYHNLIHQADLQIDGKTISETQPFLGTFTHIKLLSEMSQNDLKSIGTAIGFSEVLDTYSSAVYGAAASTVVGSSGNGLANNLAFGHSTQPLLPSGAGGAQNVNVCNEAINKRVLKVVDTTAKTNYNTIFNNTSGIVNTDTLETNDFKSTYRVNANYGILTDVAIIRLKDIFDSMSNIGLVKKFSGVLRLYVNTGSLSVTVNAPNTTIPRYNFDVSNSTFNNVCPFTINNLGAASAEGGIVLAATRINAGLFLAKALQTNLNGINLALSGASHKMQACRLYYSSITLEPEKALSYSRANQAKQIVFKNYYFNQINNVALGNTYSQLIQSGIINPYALIVVPYISSALNVGGVGYQWQSPFDTCPATGSPCILENLQVQLGGQQILQSAYNYGFETFLTQFSNCEALSSSDFGVSCGVVSKEWWEMNRIYYVNLSRSTRADQMTPRNIVLSFKNSSRIAIDVKVFTVYLDRIVLNVDTGAVTR